MRYRKNQHLRTAADFSRIRASGSRRECGFFYMYLLHLPEQRPPLRRLGVVASRRVGNAVARNRAKRRLRELFRLEQQHLPSSCDLLLIARKRMARASFADLVRRFHGALRALSREVR
ncbi:MAG: ribonuclease P protein component [Verrucomicrobia bacterium]|jgi:ribonuclease P protein component|nr:ribonuclease P protein component [Verrucomicrobiota bacterium]